MSDKVSFRQLRDAINAMPEELLDRKVVTWPLEDDGTGHCIAELEVLKEDYRHDGDEGCIPESTMKEIYDDWNDVDNPIVHPKGTVILVTA